MNTIRPILKNHVGRCISLQQANGNHQCGYIMPFVVPEKRSEASWVRLINLGTDILVHHGKSLFDMIDINEVEFTDIDCIIRGKRYGIRYIPLHTITEFVILE